MSTILLFADDSNSFMIGRDSDLIMGTMNTELKEISLWLEANKLSVNIKKTHFVIFLLKQTGKEQRCDTGC